MFLQRLLPRDSDEFTLGCGLPRTRADASHTVIRGLVSCIDGDAPLAFDIITKEGSFPAEPEKDFEVIHTHTYREMKEDITNALTILKMTDEETVNTSTYNAIARYL